MRLRFSGIERAQQASWSAHARARVGAAGSRTGSCLATPHRLGLVGDRDVDDAVGLLHVDRADVLGRERRRARRPRSSPGRPCRCSSPRWRSPRRSSRAARRCRRSSSPAAMPDQRHQARQPAEQVERAGSRARRRRPVDVARAPAAALGEQHHRQPPALGQLEQPVLLAVVAACPACRPAPCSRRTRRRARLPVDRRRCPPTSPSAGVRAISSSLRPPPLLGGEEQRPVLDERAVVDEVGDVLARRAPALLAAPRDRLGSRASSRPSACRASTASRAAPDAAPQRTRRTCSPAALAGAIVATGWSRPPTHRRDRHASPPRRPLGDDLVLHLHRLDHRDRRARARGARRARPP